MSTINLQTGAVNLTDWAGITNNTITVESLLARYGGRPIYRASWRIPGAPIVPSSVQVTATLENGQNISATSDADGKINANGIIGSVTYLVGVADVSFGKLIPVTPEIQAQPWFSADMVDDGKIFEPLPVVPDSIRYNAVVYSHLPIDAQQVGLDPVRLPPDGRVQFARAGDMLILSDEQTMSPMTVSANQTVNTARARLSRVRVIDNDGKGIYTGYTANLDAGTVTFTDITGYKQPIIIKHYCENMCQIVDAQIDGTVTMSQPLTHDFPKGAWASTALFFGDRFARVSKVFEQASWNKIKWSDSVDGDRAAASYNTSLAPIVVTNAGAITERWTLHFTNSTEVDVIGENVGNLGRHSINTDISPINPATNTPYFTVPSAGWGTGWIGGNTVFIHTIGALADAWVLQCTNKGQSAVLDDTCEFILRADVDRPQP